MKQLTPIELLQERDQLRKMKIKDYRYHIKGVDSDRPAKECMTAIVIGFYLAIGLLLLVRLIDYLITGS
jgi:hypothetical protein